MGIAFSQVNLRALAGNTAEQMLLLAEDKAQTVTVSGDVDVPVSTDPARMRQIVVNLLDNAIKYTQVNGRIELDVRAIDGRAVLEIRDNGIGVAPEAQPFLFDRFYRASHTQSAADGAGLGLSIVKSICAALGATVTLNNRDGGGAIARVTLPLAGKEE